MTADQIKHMVERFLGWQLPDDFNPDGGIAFTRHTGTPEHPHVNQPVGTNLLTAMQATAMVRHMVDGLPGPSDLPRVVDNDKGSITVSFDGGELRGWSYSSDSERRTKMVAAREYVEGWCDGREAAINKTTSIRYPSERTFVRQLVDDPRSASGKSFRDVEVVNQQYREWADKTHNTPDNALARQPSRNDSPEAPTPTAYFHTIADYASPPSPSVEREALQVARKFVEYILCKDGLAYASDTLSQIDVALSTQPRPSMPSEEEIVSVALAAYGAVWDAAKEIDAETVKEVRCRAMAAAARAILDRIKGGGTAALRARHGEE